jgi:acid phosphatase type 7
MPNHRTVPSPAARRRSRLITALAGTGILGVTAVAAVLGGGTAQAEVCTVAAAGDVAGSDDYRTGAAASADLVQQAAPVAVLALGDLAYESGTDAEFAAYYDPTWGSFKDITRPVPGNHEYNSGGGGYFRYFDVPVHYAFDVCGWRAVAVNSEVDHAQEIEFLRAEREAHPDQPLLVYWHKPRWSSGSEHGNDSGMQDLWQAAYDVGAELVLNGHDHDYERFAPMDAAGQLDPTGPREFVAGTGGHHLRPFGTVRTGSEMRVTGRPGILLLTLASSSYSWQFVDTAGVQDIGTTSILEATGSPSTPTSPTTEPSNPSGSPTVTATPTATSAPPTVTSPPPTEVTDPAVPEKCLRNDNNSVLCRDLARAIG